MPYVDGFVMAVPTANKDRFIAHASTGDDVFIRNGATRVLECWGDEVPDGTLTDFRRAVQAKEEENVVFSWIEWPDKATRDESWAKIMADPDMQPDHGNMPFDGKRMFWGGFDKLVDSAEQAAAPAERELASAK